MGATNNPQLRDLIYKTLGFAESSAQETINEIALGLTRNVLVIGKAAADGAAGDTTNLCTVPLDAKFLVTGAYIMPGGALTAHDTNYATVVLDVDDGAGGSATTLASNTTKTAGGGGTGNWTAGTAIEMTLTATIADRIIDGATARKWLGINIAKAGTGVAVPISAFWLKLKLV
jgi:hypothetical protein